MANQQEINRIEQQILENSSQPEFIQDLLCWGKQKYSRINCKNNLLKQVHSRNLYYQFLCHILRYNLHTVNDGVYHIINHLSHGEQAPMPIHIRMIMDANKDKLKKYIKKIKFNYD